jgi:hypothetical protein
MTILSVHDTLSANQSFEEVVLLSDASFNCLRKIANFSGPITPDELATLGPSPNIHHWIGSNIVAIGKTTMDHYRQQAGYTGKITKPERQRINRMIDRREVTSQLPVEVPVL